MPKIVRFERTGGPEVLRLAEEPSRQPARGEVRLRVKAAGLNRAELLFLRGQNLERPRLPSGLGYEAAGTVEAVGPDVDRSWVGKSVATVPSFSMTRYGMLGEEAIAPVSALGEYPETLSPVQGAAVWMQYVTAESPDLDRASERGRVRRDPRCVEQRGARRHRDSQSRGPRKNERALAPCLI
jgi:NADPH:quinone reductase-like Zn-dependent oxidoreductase